MKSPRTLWHNAKHSEDVNQENKLQNRKSFQVDFPFWENKLGECYI